MAGVRNAADVTAPASFRQPPGLEKEQQFVLAPPPGLESCIPLPIPGPSAAGDVEAAVWKACEEYLARRNQTLLTRTTAAMNSSVAATTPVRPPGAFFVPSGNGSHLPYANASKPSGYLQRVDSNHSLASTAATANSGSEHDQQEESGAPAKLVNNTLPESRELRIEYASNGHIKIQWPVDMKKLRGKDKHIVSPSFEIYPGSSFKLMVRPKSMGDKKGQASFQKARGCGSVDLKLLSDTENAPTLSFCISIGTGSPRGPARHNFNNSSVGGLAKHDEVFDFKTASTGANSSVVLITVEVLEALPSTLHSMEAV